MEFLIIGAVCLLFIVLVPFFDSKGVDNGAVTGKLHTYQPTTPTKPRGATRNV